MGTGVLNGYNVMVQSAVSASNGKGVYVHPMIANRSWAGYAGLTQDKESGDLYLSLVTTSDVNYLGNDLEVDLGTMDCYTDICTGKERLMLTKLSATDTTPY